MNIRALNRSDYDQWLPLWQENCLHKISDDVTAETWRRIGNPKENVFGFAAFNDNDELVGILHYILHATTGFIQPACYMQDLFVDEKHRKQGIAKQLVWELHELGKNEKWARIYWFAENNNEAAQALYKNLGVKMDFGLFILPTQ